MTINFIRRKSFKQRVWKSLNAYVAVMTILNVSMVGALVKPNIAYAAGYTLEGQRKDLTFTPGNICSGSGACYAEGENVPFRLTITGLAGSTSYSVRVQHDYKDSAGHDGYVDFNSPGTWDSSATGVGLSAPDTSAGLPNTKTYDLTFTTNSGTSTVQLKFNALLGQDAGEWNGAQLHARLVRGVEQESIGNKEVPINPDKIVIRNLTIQKSDSPDPIDLNATTTYSLLVRNTGEQAETVTVVDTLPAQMTYVPGSASLAPTSVVGSVITWSGIALAKTNGSTTITFQARGISVGTWTNTAAVSATGLTPVTDTENTTVLGQCAMTVDKFVKSGDQWVKTPTTASPGDTLSYRIVVTNTGSADCTGGGIIVQDINVDTQLGTPVGGTLVHADPGYEFTQPPTPWWNSTTRTLTWNAHTLHPATTLNPGESATIEWSASVNVTACGDFTIKNKAKATPTEIPTGVWSNEVVTTGTKVCQGTISGKKFNDLDGDSVKDAGEPGLSGWTIQLKNTSDIVLDSTVTDGSGNYSFTATAPATYRLREVNGDPANWMQTTDNPSDVALAIGQPVTGVNFGNFHKVSISGQKYNDLNGDGSKNAGEPGLAGWTIQLDKQPFGSVDASVVTDVNGNYSFTNLGPGTYRLREVNANPADWTQTTNNPDDITVTSGSNVSNIDFGNHRNTGTITVHKYFNDDTDENWERIDPQTGWSWDITNGPQNNLAGAPPVQVNTGDYTITEDPDSDYLSRWECNDQTSGDGISITDKHISKDQNLACTFYNVRKTGGLQVIKMLDADGDGDVNPNEPGGDEINPANWTWGLDNGSQGFAMGHTETVITGNHDVAENGPGGYNSSWTCVYGDDQGLISNGLGSALRVNVTTRGAQCTFKNSRKTGTIEGYKFNDLNGNGLWDQPVEPGLAGWTIKIAETNASTLTDANGHYQFNLIPVGSYTVYEMQQPGWTNTTPLSVSNVEVNDGKSTPVNFGNFELTSINGKKFDWSSEQGLGGWTIVLQKFDEEEDDFIQVATAVTNDDGTYSFVNLGPGQYRVREQLRDGWKQMSGNPNDINLVSGTPVENVDFWNFKYGKISGFKYDNHEQKLDGWQICLVPWNPELTDRSTSISVVAPNCVITGDGEWPQGYYEFTGLNAGSYRLYEIVQTSWQPVSPADGQYTGIVIASQSNLSRDFVNRQLFPDLTVTKTDGLTTATPGQQLTYTMVISNVGEFTADNVTANDTLPAQATYVSSTLNGVNAPATVTPNPSGDQLAWNIGNLANGASKTLLVTVALDATFPFGTTPLHNVVSVATTTTEPNTSNNSASDDTSVSASPILGLQKSVSPTVVPAGTNTNWTVKWSISGNANATNVVITDPIPANSTFVSVADGGVYDAVTNRVTWSLGTQAPGASGEVHYVTKAANPIANGTVITNTATIDSAETDPAISASASVTVTSAPDLTITKASDLTTFTNPGKVVNYTVVVTNKATATDTAKNVIITDTLPAGFTFAVDGTSTKTFSVGNLAPSASSTVTFLVNISGTQTAGTYTNTAKAKGDNTAEVTATAPVEVRVPEVLTAATAPQLTIIKKVDHDTAKPGDVVTYTILVQNTGDGEAVNVIVTDTLPKDLSFVHARGRTMRWELGTLLPGRTREINVDVRVESDAKRGTYVNTAVAVADELQPVQATAKLTVKVPKVLGLATTGAGPRDLAIALFGAILVVLGAVGLARRRQSTNLA